MIPDRAGVAPRRARPAGGSLRLDASEEGGSLEPYGYWLPIDISKHGAGIDRLIIVIHWFMAVLFVGWGAFYVYCCARFRRKANPVAMYEPVNAKLSKILELGVVLFEAFLLVGLSMPAWAAYKTEPLAADKALQIRVVGQQFQWNFHYAGADGKFGRVKPELMDGTNPLGIDRTDPAAHDDFFTINRLEIPKDRPVVNYVTAKDVIHSLQLNVLRLKQDAIPGTTIPVWYEAAQTGKYDVGCAQLCGNQHYRMRGELIVREAAEFDKWFAAESEKAFKRYGRKP